MVVSPETPQWDYSAAHLCRAGAKSSACSHLVSHGLLREPRRCCRHAREQLRHEEAVVLGGRERKTVEALVRRGLATYEAEYVLNEKHSYYGYRFTVRLNLETR